MKRFQLLICTLAVALFTLSAETGHAQGSTPPDGQFGLFADNGGFGFGYAFSPNFQFNTGFNFSIGDSRTWVEISPSVKYLFDGTVNPYLIGGVQVTSYEGQAGPDVYFRAGFGLEHYFSQHFGVYGHVTLLRYRAEPSPTAFDIGVAVDGDGRVGVEWFL